MYLCLRVLTCRFFEHAQLHKARQPWPFWFEQASASMAPKAPKRRPRFGGGDERMAELLLQLVVTASYLQPTPKIQSAYILKHKELIQRLHGLQDNFAFTQHLVVQRTGRSSSRSTRSGA